MRFSLSVLLGIGMPLLAAAQPTFQQQYSRTESEIGLGGISRALVHTGDGFALGGESPGSLFGVCLTLADAAGLPTSTRTYDMSADGFGEGAITAMVQLPDGGFIVAGAAPDLFFGRINADGSVAWARSAAGLYNFATAVILAADGDFVLTGKRQGNAYDAFVIKADLDGNTAWSSFYGTAVDQSEFFTSIVETPDHGFLALGYWNYNLYYMDLLVTKLDAGGAVEWSKRYGESPVNTFLYSDRISATADGNYVLTGTATTFPTNTFEPLVIKIDPAGAVLWSRKWNALQSTSGLGVTNFHVLNTVLSDQSLMVLLTDVGYPSSSMQLVHADASGIPLSSVSIRNLQQIETATDMVLLPNDATALCGYNSTGTYVASSFLIATDMQGNSPCNDSASTATATDLSLPLVDGAVTASPCTFTYTALTPAVADIALDHLDICSTNGIGEVAMPAAPAITAVPSPAANTVRITLTGARTTNATTLELVDASGTVVRTIGVNGLQQVLLERRGLPAGLYLLRWPGGNGNAAVTKVLFE